jgi:gas vesicle protein
MIEKLHELIACTDKMVQALEKYNLIPGVTDADVRQYKLTKDRLLFLVSEHAERSRGLIFLLGKRSDTDYELGKWEILAGPFDSQAQTEIVLSNEEDPLIAATEEFAHTASNAAAEKWNLFSCLSQTLKDTTLINIVKKQIEGIEKLPEDEEKMLSDCLAVNETAKELYDLLIKASQRYKDAVSKNNEVSYPYDEVIVVKEVSVSENEDDLEDDLDNDMEDDYEDWEG